MAVGEDQTALRGMTQVILMNMKTAISIPDALFEAGEAAAKRLGLSRSELYRTALREFLAEHDARTVTEALDAVYAEDQCEEAQVEPMLRSLQAASIEDEDW
jgi:metal-responsive CopG/Arc/MetJ family transcriptional regulator